jgi:hypothetical protein
MREFRENLKDPSQAHGISKQAKQKLREQRIASIRNEYKGNDDICW